MPRQFKKDRRVRLHGKPDEERAWAAIMVLTQGKTWVDLDTVGDFLRMRQHEADRVRHDPKDPATRYALPKSVLKWPKGWEVAVIARAVSLAMDHQTIEHRHAEGPDGRHTNEFRGVPQFAHDLWTYPNTSLPAPKGGFSTPLQKTE